jgi:hypothetical protein
MALLMYSSKHPGTHSTQPPRQLHCLESITDSWQLYAACQLVDCFRHQVRLMTASLQSSAAAKLLFELGPSLAYSAAPANSVTGTLLEA